MDDGAETLESALEALASFRDSGVRRVVTTPHLDAGHVASPRRGRIDAAFQRLAEAASTSVPEVRLELSYEIRIDDPEIDLSDRSLGLSDGGGILVEFPQLSLPAYSARMLELVGEQDWTPVLAHPERYAGVGQAYRWIELWREMGVILCVNVGSLFGEHGAAAQQVARRMLEAGHADLIGSDHHARPHRSTLLRRARDFFDGHHDPDFAEAGYLLTQANPAAVLEGRAPAAVPPLTFPAGWLDRVRRLFRG